MASPRVFSGLHWTMPKGTTAPGNVLPPPAVPMKGLTWAAGSAVLSWVRDQIQLLTGTSIPGHAAVAIAIAAVGVIVVLALRGRPVSYRAFVLLLLGAAVVAYILYNPGAVANTA